MEENIRVLVIDDHTVVRDGLVALISASPGMEVVGSGADGEAAVALARELDPDVILLDLVMPKMDGVQAITTIREHNSDARILVLTSFAENHQVYSAIKSGAIGYLMKNTSSDELLDAIRDTYNNRPVLQPAIARKLMRDIQIQESETDKDNLLTERESEILRQVARGKTNQEIADDLFLSERTVRTHLTNILAKLQLSNRTQAALFALREGIAHLEYTVDEEES
ncbi:MAG: response regulator transcription factor [Anaerolineales bacterium]|nr:response regulator transcription factor [Anaerolineales bacterium]